MTEKQVTPHIMAVRFRDEYGEGLRLVDDRDEHEDLQAYVVPRGVADKMGYDVARFKRAWFWIVQEIGETVASGGSDTVREGVTALARALDRLSSESTRRELDKFFDRD